MCVCVCVIVTHSSSREVAAPAAPQTSQHQTAGACQPGPCIHKHTVIETKLTLNIHSLKIQCLYCTSCILYKHCTYT